MIPELDTFLRHPRNLVPVQEKSALSGQRTASGPGPGPQTFKQIGDLLGVVPRHHQPAVRRAPVERAREPCRDHLTRNLGLGVNEPVQFVEPDQLAVSDDPRGQIAPRTHLLALNNAQAWSCTDRKPSSNVIAAVGCVGFVLSNSASSTIL